MRLLITLVVIFSTYGITKTNNAEALCARCIEINENNKKIVNDFFYYEEYLEKNSIEQ